MKQKILVVDDDPDFVESLKIRLEHEQYEVLSANEGVRAIEVAHRSHPDLIVLDWKMPAGQGPSVMELLAKRENTKKIPVIVVTGMVDPSVREKAFSLGAKDFMLKPPDVGYLIRRIKKFIDGGEI